MFARIRFTTWALALLVVAAPGSPVAANDVTRPVWVFFSDRDLGSVAAEDRAIAEAARALTPRALERRRSRYFSRVR